MSEIFISGGGSEQISFEFDLTFKKFMGNKKKILYIPWAFYPEKYDDCSKWIKGIFTEKEGYEITVLTENEIINENIVDKFDVIYIGGGNTFRLLKLIKTTGLFYILKQFINKGKKIYGGSAGAIILGKEINTSPDLNVEKLNFEESLGVNLFGNFSIFCHYQEEQDFEIYNYVKNYGYNIIALKEGVGLYNDGSNLLVGGKGSAYLFTSNEKREYKKGEQVIL